MDWFDELLEETKDATERTYTMSTWEAPTEEQTEKVNGVNTFVSFVKINRANAMLASNSIKMRDEIIRLRKLLSASEMVNTHSSLDEK